MSERSRVPNALRRLARERFRLIAIVLLGVVALVAAAVQSGAAIALRSSLDANWRGLYDILVFPSGAEFPGPSLPPNSLHGSTKGLGFDDLAAIRGVSGVEVAAPIGEIAVPLYKSNAPQLTVPRDAIDASAPQGFRVIVEYTTDDGLGERLVSTTSEDIVVDARPLPPPSEDCELHNVAIDAFSDIALDDYPALRAYLCTVLGAQLTSGVYTILDDGSSGYFFHDVAPDEPLASSLPAPPSGVTRITLVDPVAERALLGDRGAFLDPLIALDQGGPVSGDRMTAWARGDTTGFGQDYLDYLARQAAGSTIPADALADERRLYADHGEDYDDWLAQQNAASTTIPLLVSDALVAPLTVRVSVSAVGPVSITVDENGHARLGAFPDTNGTPIGVTSSDDRVLLNPFVRDGGDVAWPGTTISAGDMTPHYAPQAFSEVGRILAPPTTTDGAGSTLLAPAGYADPTANSRPNASLDQHFDLDAEPGDPGVEAAYTAVQEIWQPTASASWPGSVPVGAFDPDVVTDTDAANYVPLGAYEPVGSTITGGVYDGAELQPSVSGLGLVSPRTVAIGPIDAASAWGEEDPIDAVRVRVSGIEGYSAAAQQRVVEVAQRIESLGYRAIVVAGASPVPTDVRVSGYAFGVQDPGAAQQVGPLGTVVQQWSELGAAARAEVSISQTSLLLLWLALGGTIVLLGATQLAAIPMRRERAAVMRTLGFTRGRIARWIAGEECVGLAVVVLAAAAAIPLSGASALSLLVAGSGLAVAAALALAATVAGSRSPAIRVRRPRRRDRLGARSIAGFGVRQARINAPGSLAHAAAIAIVALAAAGFAAAILHGRAAGGTSLLAVLLGNEQLIAQLVLAAATIVAGIVLALLGRRLDLQRRETQWAALRATGWTGRERAAAQRIEGLVVSAPTILAAGAATAGLAFLLDLPEPWLLVALAVVGGAITSWIAFAQRRKELPA